MKGGGHIDILLVGGLHIAAEVVDLGFLAFTADKATFDRSKFVLEFGDTNARMVPISMLSVRKNISISVSNIDHSVRSQARMMPTPEDDQGAIHGDPMIYLQNWIDQVDPMAALPSIAILFLIASIAGWYVGNLLQWLRR